jgi:hypothetical protein
LSLTFFFATVTLSLLRHSPRPNLCTTDLFRRRFYIYLGHIRRQSSLDGHLSCILSAHLPHSTRFASNCPPEPQRSRHTACRLRELPRSITSTPYTQSRAATMSFNIASDGSPTPRKGSARFSIPGDLKVDTSSEALGQAVGGMSLDYYPCAFQRVFGSALTSNTQGFKRPLGPSTLGNRPLLQQRDSLNEYKVSIPRPCHFMLCVCLPYRRSNVCRSPVRKLMGIEPWLSQRCSASIDTPLSKTRTALLAVLSP